MLRFDRFARALVRLYPRAWRARYEDEFLALLDVTPPTWHLLLDILAGAVRERARRAWRAVAAPNAHSAPFVPWTGTKALLAFAALSASGWVVGRWIAPYVDPDIRFLAWVPLLLMFRFDQVAAATADLPPVPVFVVHPFRPDRLVRVRMPIWIRVPFRILFLWWNLLQKIPLPAPASRAARRAAAMLLFALAVLLAVGFVTRSALDDAQTWTMLLMGFSQWFLTVGEVWKRPPEPEVSGR